MQNIDMNTANSRNATRPPQCMPCCQMLRYALSGKEIIENGILKYLDSEKMRRVTTISRTRRKVTTIHVGKSPGDLTLSVSKLRDRPVIVATVTREIATGAPPRRAILRIPTPNSTAESNRLGIQDTSMLPAYKKCRYPNMPQTI